MRMSSDSTAVKWSSSTAGDARRHAPQPSGRVVGGTRTRGQHGAVCRTERPEENEGESAEQTKEEAQVLHLRLRPEGGGWTERGEGR